MPNKELCPGSNHKLLKDDLELNGTTSCPTCGRDALSVVRTEKDDGIELSVSKHFPMALPRRKRSPVRSSTRPSGRGR